MIAISLFSPPMFYLLLSHVLLMKKLFFCCYRRILFSILNDIFVFGEFVGSICAPLGSEKDTEVVAWLERSCELSD
jgi:hypothetical protein